MAVSACGGSEAADLPGPDDPVAVRTVEVREATEGRTFPARVEAMRSAGLATRIGGTIQRIPVDVGDRVRAGDTVAVLDDSDLRARLAGAESQVDLAGKTFRRIEALAADGAASQQELDEARARLEAAEAVLREARSQEPYFVLRAPFSGVVTARHADPGDLATPGATLLRLKAGDRVKVVGDLPSALTSRVRVGTTVTLLRDGSSLTGRVSRVVPAIAPGSRRFRIEALPEAPASGTLLPGSWIGLSLSAGAEPSFWIPSDALVRRGQLVGVYTVRDGRLDLRWVRTGQEKDGAVEILSGLAGGEVVVRSPDPDLYDGLGVSEATRESWAPSSVRAGEGS